MQIISGSSNKLLAKRIAESTGYRLLNTEIRNFSDGELRVELQDKIEKDVIILQSTSSPVNDHLMELLLLILLRPLNIELTLEKWYNDIVSRVITKCLIKNYHQAISRY